MGACYSVCCKLKFKQSDEQKALTKMQECYIKQAGKTADFCIEKYPFKEPHRIQDYLGLYFTEHQDMYDYNRSTLANGNVIYEIDSGFDASYGWHGIMLEFFESIAEYLMRGRYLKILDDDAITYRIKDGKVV